MSWCQSCTTDLRSLTIGFVGLDGAGKTTAVKALCKEATDEVRPTVGFTPSECRFKHTELTLYDLGGGSRIRDVWAHYYAEMHGLVFVVDAADSARIDEAAWILETVALHPAVAGKPVLILANKQDQAGCVNQGTLSELLGTAKLTSRAHPCQFTVHQCQAKRRKGSVDKGIYTGMKWLIYTIEAQLEGLQERIERQTKEQQEREKQERREKQKRVQFEREERERMSASTLVESIEHEEDPERGLRRQSKSASADLMGPHHAPKRKLLRPIAEDDGDLNDSVIEPSTDALALKVMVSLAVYADQAADVDRHSFEWKLWRRGAKEAWHELRKQHAGGRRLSAERVARKSYIGWGQAAVKCWDAKRYGPKPKHIEMDDGRLSETNFDPDGPGLAAYRSTCMEADHMFESASEHTINSHHVAAEVLLEQYQRTHASSRRLPIQKRRPAVLAALHKRGLPVAGETEA